MEQHKDRDLQQLEYNPFDTTLFFLLPQTLADATILRQPFANVKVA